MPPDVVESSTVSATTETVPTVEDHAPEAAEAQAALAERNANDSAIAADVSVEGATLAADAAEDAAV